MARRATKIEGIGSPELIITGVERLHGCQHSVIADRIEAGTFIIAAAMTRGTVRIEGIAPRRLGAFLDKLEEAGLPLEYGVNSKKFKSALHGLAQTSGRDHPAPPGLPHRSASPIVRAPMTQTEGISILTERDLPQPLHACARASTHGR